VFYAKFPKQSFVPRASWLLQMQLTVYERIAAQSFSSQLLASQQSNRSLSCRWYSFCKRWGNLFSVVAQIFFALQVRTGSQFRARQALNFSANLQALTRATSRTLRVLGQPKAVAFVCPFCWR